MFVSRLFDYEVIYLLYLKEDGENKCLKLLYVMTT